ncbi:MAG: response regulator [Candidatus Omnitrophica bacterium]|nr:response regulator [Candidatus Omnitrophota bacterium]
MNKKILVVDDEEHIVLVLRKFLEVSGYAVFVASDGKEGFERVKEVKPDLILMDAVMPNQDGYTTVRKIRALKLEQDSELATLSAIPIIVMTAQGPHMQDIFELEGISAYITKPFKNDEVLDAIRGLLGE